MNKKKLVPRLRFAEFENTTSCWEKQKLGNITQYFNGGSYENNVQSKGEYELVTLKSIDMEGNFVNSNRYIDIKVPTLTKGTLVMILSEQSPGLLGMTARVPEDNMYVLNQRVAEIRPNEEINSYFLSMIINKNQQYFSRHGAGTKVQNISKVNVENFELACPTIHEQQRIGKFYESIDKIIQLQQSKVNKVKDIKSAYLSEMFPKEGEKYPKSRFEGFTEPWERRKLGLLLDYEQPTDYLVSSDAYDDSYTTPVLTAGKSFLLGYTNETDGIYKVNKDNGVIIFDDFTTSSHFVDFDFKVKSSAMKFLRSTQSGLNLYFLYNLLKNINYNPESHERHWISIFSEFDVLIPGEKEQQKIAKFFENLDNQISIEEEKLDKLEKLKQAYLNDMFV